MQEAVGLHRAGRLREAGKLYARVLKAAPSHFDALHLSGLCKAQNGQMGEAYRLIAAALKINARAPEAWLNFANVLHALKRDGEALDALDRALALRPDDAARWRTAAMRCCRLAGRRRRSRHSMPRWRAMRAGRAR